MIKLTYLEFDGTPHQVEVEEGMTLMEGATLNMVPGVEGMCGGICSCATCHCYLPGDGKLDIPSASSGEDAMLDGVAERRPTSRLGCQVRVTPEFDGIVIHLPKVQGSGD